jgi:hypothetical protein
MKRSAVRLYRVRLKHCRYHNPRSHNFFDPWFQNFTHPRTSFYDSFRVSPTPMPDRHNKAWWVLFQDGVNSYDYITRPWTVKDRWRNTDGENRQHSETQHQGHMVWTRYCGVKDRRPDAEAGNCSGTAQSPYSGWYTLQLVVIPQPTPVHRKVPLYARISLHVTTASFQILIPLKKNYCTLFIYFFAYSFIPQSALRKVRSPFQSELSTQ